jgi:hypothetical protein
MTYLLLNRAFDNFGDYLIFERAEKIIKHEVKGIDLIYANASISLDKQLSENDYCELNGVILPGGPGIRNKLFPKVYPLSKRIFEKNIPIYFMGVGSKFFMNLNKKKSFDKKSMDFLKYVTSHGPIGCRDEFTSKYLQDMGFDSVMNGCPAWYDLEYFGKRIKTTKNIKNILVSVPGSDIFFNQFTYLLTNIIEKYPECTFYVSFNHGFKNDRFKKLKSRLNGLNIHFLDMSCGTNRAFEYDKMDLHIGYRVHTHIYFLSHRKPSVILAEDSRGVGVMDVLETPGFMCWDDKDPVILPKCMVNRFLGHDVFNVNGKTDNVEILKFLMDSIEELNSDNYSTYNKVFDKMEKIYHSSMKPYVQKYIL